MTHQQSLGRYVHIDFSGRPVRSRRERTERFRSPTWFAEPKSEDARVLFLRNLLDQAGVDGTAYRSGPLARRFDACLRALQAGDLSRAGSRIEGNPELIESGSGALLIGVTEFFRDPPLFPRIRDMVLPSLRAGGRPLRVWSVGCSDGSELYSIAILLSEAGILKGSTLLGTDCRSAALFEARSGWFRPQALRHLPEDLRSRYLLETTQGFEVLPCMRAATSWGMGDVLSRTEPGPWDLILCRNLAMYLKEAAARNLWDRLLFSLRPGGFLVTGRAERPGRSHLLWAAAPCIYQKQPESSDAA